MLPQKRFFSRIQTFVCVFDKTHKLFFFKLIFRRFSAFFRGFLSKKPNTRHQNPKISTPFCVRKPSLATVNFLRIQRFFKSGGKVGWNLSVRIKRTEKRTLPVRIIPHPPTKDNKIKPLFTQEAYSTRHTRNICPPR